MNIKKSILLALILSISIHIYSEEGMYPLFMIDEGLHQRMQQMGLNLSLEELYSEGQPGLLDAIVSFGGYCTGSIISDKGLVLTNHHCGYGRIQSHSCVDNDYLFDGFWASDYSEELPNPGLYVSFVVSVEDVTQQIKEKLESDMTEDERNSKIREISAEIQNEATEDTHYNAQVRSFYDGNEFYLLVYETYNDVRLVGAPPSSIGKYGGDTDNWMWPRHTGDFALFRVYSSPEGMPAEYSPENIPLEPKHYLPVSINGVEENDFAMTVGYAGNTDRYLTSWGIDFRLEEVFPLRIDIRRKKLDIIEEAMAESNEVRIKYASKHAGIANYWKNFIGMSQALKRLNVANQKREIENNFQNWFSESPERQEKYGEVLSDFEKAYEGLKPTNNHYYNFIEAMWTGPDMLRFAYSFKDLSELLEDQSIEEEDIANRIERLSAQTERLFANYHKPVDMKLWEEMFELYYQKVPEEQHPEIFEVISKKYNNDFAKYAADIYKKSIFTEQSKVDELLDNPERRQIEKDPIYKAAVSIFENYQEISAHSEQYDQKLDKASRLFIKGLREMYPDSLFYPDANSTIRLSFGKVRGYQPADAVYYDYLTTLEGVMEKEDPDDHEFIVPERLKELYENKDYGKYGDDDVMFVNFLSINDITGGNSGSPVINGDGHVIGVAFDGNWEAMSGDILFEPELQRCINVDARYILFIIEKYANANHLIDEMTIIN